MVIFENEDWKVFGGYNEEVRELAIEYCSNVPYGRVIILIDNIIDEDFIIQHLGDICGGFFSYIKDGESYEDACKDCIDYMTIPRYVNHRILNTLHPEKSRSKFLRDYTTPTN